MEKKDSDKLQVEQQKLDINAIYVHKKSGLEYRIKHITKMKHPDTGVWIPAVIYEGVITGIVWCRSMESFINDYTDFVITDNDVLL